MELNDNARIRYEKRYLKRDRQGNVVETPEDLLHRVAGNIAAVEKDYGQTEEDIKEVEESFYEILSKGYFLPNSPTLMNAGRDLQQLSACFVLPVEDSMEGIFNTLKYMALVQKTGGGTGFSFGRLRPNGDVVCSTNGVASGPISFLKIFDSATEAVKQGGTRRGANMGSLSCYHPDIMEFISCKEKDEDVNNFNLSVAVSHEFMKKATGEDPEPYYDLINPRDNKPYINPESQEVMQLNATEIFAEIIEKAWKNGDPGIIFIDQMNKYNPTPKIGLYETTNPCGEQPLLPYEACCLGSINLGKMVLEQGKVDWEKLGDVVEKAVRFLDNVIDASEYVIPEIAKMHKDGNRKIGLGVMGWHDMLVRLGIPYDSNDALDMALEVMNYINTKAKEMSVELAKDRGVFANFDGSIYDTGKEEDRVRNATRTTIAPTGTISILAGASSGVEPYFSIAFLRKNVLGGVDMPEVNQLFIEKAKEEGFYSEELLLKIASQGSVQNQDEVPAHLKALFKTAMDIDVDWHVKHQAAFQKYTDNAVSKTINLKKEATREDVKHSYLLAWRSGCKGITIYRDSSRQIQVLNVGTDSQKEDLKPTKRPKTLHGNTTNITTPLGNLFVTLNALEKRPFEVFAQIGKAGSDVVPFTEAIARLISLALRCGVSLDEIVNQLEGIGGARSVGFGPNRIMSVPDAMGRALKELAKSASAKENNSNSSLEICPDCGTGALIRAEGCSKCEACGFSEC